MIQFLINGFENSFIKFRLLIINNMNRDAVNHYKKFARETTANTQEDNRNNIAET